MKKILICANTLCIGGIEKSLINLLKNIDKSQFKIDLMLEERSGELIKEVPKNINILEYKVYNLKNKFIQKLLNFLNQIKWTLKYKNKYDTSICFATYSYAANKVARILSKNRILFVHSDYTKIYNETELKEFFDTRNLSDFNIIIFVSNESKENLIKFYPNIVDKSLVINNIIDINEIKEKSEYKIEKIYNKNNINLLFIGRLEEESKNISTQLKLIKDLSIDIPNIKLFIVGDGPNKNDYIKYVRENNLEKYIEFIGQKENPYPYIKNADYVLLTSNYEGYPVIFNESILLKTDILSTIKISDDYTCIGENFGYLLSNNYNETLNELKIILKTKKHKKTNINLEEINKKRLKKLEELLNE